MLRLRHAAHQGSDCGRRLSGASAGLQGQLRPTKTKQAPWLMSQVPPWDPDEFHRNVVIPDAAQSSCRFDRQSFFRYSRLRPSSEDAPSTHTLQRLRRCCRHRHGAAAGSCAGSAIAPLRQEAVLLTFFLCFFLFGRESAVCELHLDLVRIHAGHFSGSKPRPRRWPL